MPEHVQAGMRFAKMHGAGNDFIMLDERDLPDGKEPAREEIAALCRRRTGIGADGLIVVGAADDGAVRMVYYNADGGRAEMCGNGARCAASFAHRRGLIAQTGFLQTDAGRLAVRVLQRDDIEIALPAHRGLELDIDLGLGQDQKSVLSAHFCNTGVPHLVLLTENVDAVDARQAGRPIRHHPRFGPEGANVNWIGREEHSNAWKLRTYERGVEDETLACGTGAAAAAVVLAGLGLADPPVAVRTGSGDLLHVTWERPDGPIHLRGPAVLVFEGKVSGDA